MSKTEIVTPETERRQMTNEINRAVRHCRIGKVTEKRPRHYGPPTIFPHWPFTPPARDDFTFRWPQIYSDRDVPDMCRQSIGKACGSVACPRRPVVTCGVEYGRYNEITTANRLGLDAYGA